MQRRVLVHLCLTLAAFLWLARVRAGIPQAEENPSGQPESELLLTNTAGLAGLFLEGYTYPLGSWVWTPTVFQPMTIVWADTTNLPVGLAGITNFVPTSVEGVPGWPLWVTLWPQSNTVTVLQPWSDGVLTEFPVPDGFPSWQVYETDLSAPCILSGINYTNWETLVEEGYTQFSVPQVVTHAWLMDLSNQGTYWNNVEANWATAEAATASATSMNSRFMSMDDPVSCVITDEAAPFSVVSLAPDGNGGMVLEWESCSDHIYVVQRASGLTPTSSWTDVAWMFGANEVTSWTDTNALAQAQGFYRVVRANPSTLNNGIPYGWAVDNGLDPLDPNLAWEDPDGDCLDNLQEYLQGTDPLNPSPILITLGTVYAGSVTNTFSVVPNLAPLYSFSSGPPLGIIQSSIDSNLYGVAYTNTDDGDQIVFKMTPQGAMTTLYSFSTVANGYYPWIPMQASDGNFYGVCYLGGNTTPSYCNGTVIGYGTVFQLTPQGVLTNLHLFAGPPEGSCPVGGLIQGTDGSFYGVTEVGGSNNCLDSYCCDPSYGGYGTVFKLTPQGTLTTLHTFSGGADGAFPEAALLQASDGYLYGTASAGNGNAGTIFKVSTTGTFTPLYAFTGGPDGASPLASLIQDGGGILYGTTFGGGTSGAGTVFSITTNGALTTLHSFGGTPDGYAPESALAQGLDGNFYGATVWGGTTNTNPHVQGPPPGNGIVFKMTPQGTLTTIYQFSGGFDGGSPNLGALVKGSFDGYFYGTTTQGGANGWGTLFKFVPTTYTWSLTSGSFASGQGSPYLAVTTASPCPVTLSVAATNSLGCSNSGSITVTPAAPLPSSNSPITVGQTLNLSVPTVTGATYSWTGPNGFASTNQNPSIANIQPCGAGQYCVAVIASGCTSLASCVSVTVNAPQPTSNSPVCEGQTLSLSVSNVTAATYSWTGPNGFSSTSQNPSVANATTNATGVYCVALSVSSCTSAPSCTSVTINPLPTAIVSGGGATNCAGSSANIQATLTGTKPWIVTWSDGVIQSNVTVNPATRSVNPYSTTSYTVTALSDRNCPGGTASGSATVTVTTNVTSSVVVSNEVLIVYNSNTSFPDSLACKNYYIAHRPGFSNANVLACSCTTTGTDGFESVTTDDLTNQIVNPIINFMLSHTNKSIHYVALMYGMPSRVSDGYRYSVQHNISRCMSDAGYTSGPYYEGSTCPFVATNFLGTTCLVTALNMATLADCTAYVDKVTSMYTGNVIISAEAAVYSNSNYYLDDTRDVIYQGSPEAAGFQSAILGKNPSANITYSSNMVIGAGGNIKGYVGWGVHNDAFVSAYPTNGSVVWSGSSKWWIIETIESFNGQRAAALGLGGQQPQGDVEEWFASNAWGGANYTNTPVGAVSHVEEPELQGVNGPTYMSLWEEGFLFSECAWASKNTPEFQAIGDPLLKQ